ncbi:MAG: AI-2E family transporter [Bacteroidales bacterium]|nr:AI-2E family transporter [Bacteroidales bacterium]
MSFFEKEFTFDRVVRIIITILIIGALLFLLNYFSAVLIPFVIALIIAYFLNPFINYIQKIIKKRGPAVIVGILLIASIFTGIFFIIIPMISKEVNHAGHLINQLFTNTDWTAQIDKYLPEATAKKVKAFIENPNIQEVLSENQIKDAINFGIKKVLPELGSVLGYTIEIIIGVLGLTVILMYLFFILLDFNDIISLWKSMIPPKYKNAVLGFSYDFEFAMNNYFRAQALIATIVGILFSIGFTAIGLPLGILLGIIIGFLNMIPYLQNIALLPAVFLAMLKSLETGQNFWVILGLVLLIFVIVQAIQDGVLVPKIMGDATGLNPAIIILSLSLWGKMLGMLGLLIALPMTYLLLSYYKRMIAKTQKMEGPAKQKTDFDLITQNLRKLPGEEE